MARSNIVYVRNIQLFIGLIVLVHVFPVGAQEISETTDSEARSPAQSQVVDERSLTIDDAPVDADSTEVSNAIGVGDVLRLLLVLLVVVALIYGTFLLLRRATRSHYKTSELLELISSLPLGGSRAIHVVKIATKYYIVGCAEQGVELISEITDKDAIDIINSHVPQSQGTKSFGEQLGSLLSIFGKKASSQSSASSVGTSSFVDIKKQSSRLSNIKIGSDIESMFSQDS